jgi:transcriptional regulator with XRE-family HTH domain
MKHQLDAAALAALVRAKRAGRGLREIAEEIGEISPATLSRVENEKAPDMTTFLRLCEWLQVAPAQLLAAQSGEAATAPDRPQQIALLLRSDRQLDPATANALASLVEAAYAKLPPAK